MFELMIHNWMVLILLGCSIAAVMVVVNRWMFFRKMDSVHMAERILQKVSEKQMDEARQLAAASDLPVSRVLAEGLRHPSMPGMAMEETGNYVFSTMQRGLMVLDTIVTMAPLLGLLGTIIGMMDTFSVIAVSSMQEPHAITGGVADALIATAVGITVAVATLVPYNYFTARAENEAAIIERYATRLEMLLQQQNGAETA